MRTLRFILAGVWILSSAPAFAEEEIRLLVSIGSNVGNPDEAPLRWAEADAQRMHRLFIELGNVAPERAYLVTGKAVVHVREQLAHVAGRMADSTCTPFAPTLLRSQPQ